MIGWVGMLPFRDYFYIINKRKEGNVLFNDALDTFYLWLYGVRYLQKIT